MVKSRLLKIKIVSGQANAYLNTLTTICVKARYLCNIINQINHHVKTIFYYLFRGR
jgi:hypothetical protein